ncbi:hypothetical protein F4859DRAFT_517994 [Xylaria cf. heliscus]|nr:hypothetical protein F4859DRAFT_517994 [Xylaria cf. heliscus]
MPLLSITFLQWVQELEAAYKAYKREAATSHVSYIERLPVKLRPLAVENLAEALYELGALGDKALIPKILDRHGGRHNTNWYTLKIVTKFSVGAGFLELDVVVRYWAKKLAYLTYPAVDHRDKYEFIFEQGLVRMRVLDVIAPWKLGRYMRWIQQESDLKHSSALVPAVPSEFLPTEFNFDTGEIFRRYPEGDDGPKFWWYYWLLTECPTDSLMGMMSLTSACQSCTFTLGYIFWDLQRLKQLTREECPSIDDRVQSTKGVSIREGEIFKQFFFKHSGLNLTVDLACSCPLLKR